MPTNFCPYIDLAHLLVKKRRRGFGNMFRHQIDTFAILVEYGYKDPVLLKAALIHDLFEDGNKIGFSDFDSIISIDSDGKEVYELVKEVSIKLENEAEEPKPQFLERIMKSGSQNAKILKLADRLSNINSLPAAFDNSFTDRYIAETKSYILPYSDKIDTAISSELNQSIEKLSEH